MTAAVQTPWEEVHRIRAAFAYSKFKGGWDTKDIALRMNITEAKAHKLVTLGRCYARSLANPYPV